MSVTLSEIKEHVVVGADESHDDALLERFIAAAKGRVADHLRRDLDAEFPGGWPDQINQAVSFMVAHWYANREAIGSGEMLLAVKDILAPWRDLS